jgi:hypothetical protein
MALLLAILLITTLFAGCSAAPGSSNMGAAGDYYEGENKKPGFGAHATTAMFVGLCGAYIGAYIGEAVTGRVIDESLVRDVMPLIVAVISGAAMAVFEYFIQKKGKAVLENFSLAASMLIAMAAAVLIGML